MIVDKHIRMKEMLTKTTYKHYIYIYIYIYINDICRITIDQDIHNLELPQPHVFFWYVTFRTSFQKTCSDKNLDDL